MEKKKYTADGKFFASCEELWFYYWIQEARGAGLIGAFSYQPHTFELAEKTVDEKGRHLLNNVEYTPDFQMMCGRNFHIFGNRTFHRISNDTIWIDVKGKFGMYGDSAKFSLLQKWMYQKYGIYVQKLIPEKFFEQTFVPRLVAYKRNGEIRTKFTACRFLPEFLNENAKLI